MEILKEEIFQDHMYNVYDEVIIINANQLTIDENYSLRQLARDYKFNYWISDCSNNRILFPHIDKNNVCHVTGRIAYLEDIEINNKQNYIEFKMDSIQSFEYALHMMSEYLKEEYDVKIKFNLKKEEFEIKILK